MRKFSHKNGFWLDFVIICFSFD